MRRGGIVFRTCFAECVTPIGLHSWGVARKFLKTWCRSIAVNALRERHVVVLSNACGFPKLDVAGSSPVSRSMFSVTYDDFRNPPKPSV